MHITVGSGGFAIVRHHSMRLPFKWKDREEGYRLIRAIYKREGKPNKGELTVMRLENDYHDGR